MKTKILTICMLAVLLVVGCSEPNVLKSYVIASNAVTGAAEAGTVLVEAGAFTPEETTKYGEILDKADAILKLWRAALFSGSTQGFTIEPFLEQLIEMQVAAMQRQKVGE